MTNNVPELNNFQRIYEKIATGAQTKYIENIHIPLLLDRFSEGKDIASFCADAEICRDTFFDWIRKNKNFSKAYEMAKELARSHFERVAEKGLHNPHFNISLWNIQMRNRFGYTSERKLKLAKLKAAKTPLEQFNVIKGEVAEGNLTASETNHMAAFVATGAKIDEFTIMKNDVENLKDLILKDKQ